MMITGSITTITQKIIFDIHCCTTLLTLAIQSVCVRLEVTFEPILEVEVTLRYESWVV
jgi:hypothetical protein